MPKGIPRFPMTSASLRFMHRVRPEEAGCWIWEGSVGTHGYGMFGCFSHLHRKADVSCLAHVSAFRLFVGPIPDGKEIHHECRNKKCVYPGHLRAVTRKEHRRLEGNGAKTHCKRGHEFSGENAIINRFGHRSCRICRDLHNRKMI